jgi:hypothetical protein
MSLSGRHVVVTRPAGQAAHFATALAGQGAIPVLYPVLEIRELEDVAPLLDVAIRLDGFDLAVFVSPNAIEQALARILPRRPWPPGLRVAALGKSSERELARHGITDVISPQLRFDSEALLELPELTEVQGKRVIIFRGEGGRELLGETLKATRRRHRIRQLLPPRAAANRSRAPAQALGARPARRRDPDQQRRLAQFLRHGRPPRPGLADPCVRAPKTPAGFVPHQRIAEQAQRPRTCQRRNQPPPLTRR